MSSIQPLVVNLLWVSVYLLHKHMGERCKVSKYGKGMVQGLSRPWVGRRGNTLGGEGRGKVPRWLKS